jgi:hypothetical protein
MGVSRDPLLSLWVHFASLQDAALSVSRCAAVLTGGASVRYEYGALRARERTNLDAMGLLPRTPLNKFAEHATGYEDAGAVAADCVRGFT